MKLLILFYFLRDCTDGIKIENEKFFERNSEEKYFSIKEEQKKINSFFGRNWRKGILQVKIQIRIKL